MKGLNVFPFSSIFPWCVAIHLWVQSLLMIFLGVCSKPPEHAVKQKCLSALATLHNKWLMESLRVVTAMPNANAGCCYNDESWGAQCLWGICGCCKLPRNVLSKWWVRVLSVCRGARVFPEPGNLWWRLVNKQTEVGEGLTNKQVDADA